MLSLLLEKATPWVSTFFWSRANCTKYWHQISNIIQGKKLANNDSRKSIKMLRSTDYYSKKQLAESAPFFDRALTASRQFGFGWLNLRWIYLLNCLKKDQYVKKNISNSEFHRMEAFENCSKNDFNEKNDNLMTIWQVAIVETVVSD